MLEQFTEETRGKITVHATDVFPEECCGFVLLREGKVWVERCKNVAKKPREFFQISDDDYLKAKAMGDLQCVYHSHPNAAAALTFSDKAVSEEMELPFVVIAIPSFSWAEHIPQGWEAPLVGRPFLHGVHDCYSLVKDYYHAKLGIDLPNFAREDEWWTKGQNLYLENFEKAGFVRVNDLKEHDCFLMTIASKVPNHAAIYTRQNLILQHVYGRLSGHAPYGGFWLKNTYCTVRHSSLL